MEDIEEEYLNLGQLMVIMAGQGRFYENQQGVEMILSGTFMASLTLWGQGAAVFSLIVEMDEDDPSLSRMLNFRTSDDVEAFGEAELWAFYAQGIAYVSADLAMMDGVELQFRVSEAKTVVSCEVLDYEDEVYGVWDDVEQFRNYIREHVRELYVAMEDQEID